MKRQRSIPPGHGTTAFDTSPKAPVASVSAAVTTSAASPTRVHAGERRRTAIA
jgi:hypothetical protein